MKKIDIDKYIGNNIAGIYYIKNIKNEKVYIGSSKDIKKRLIQHLFALEKNKHHSHKLQRSWNKSTDKSVFIFGILETVKNIEYLLDIEQTYIDSYNSFENGYNCSKYTRDNSYTEKYSRSKKRKNEINDLHEYVISLIKEITLSQNEKIINRSMYRRLLNKEYKTPVHYKNTKIFLEWYKETEYINDKNAELHLNFFKGVYAEIRLFEEGNKYWSEYRRFRINKMNKVEMTYIERDGKQLLNKGEIF